MEDKNYNDRNEGNLNYIFDGDQGGRGGDTPPEKHYRSYYERPLPPQSNASKNFVKIFISISLAAMIFALGFLTAYEFIPSEEEKLARWIKNTVEQHFLDVEGGGVNLVGPMGSAMVASLDDYSSFYYAESMEKMDQQNNGIYNEIGFQLYKPQDEEYTRILKVYGNSPAYNAGIKAGDIILKAVEGDTEYDFKNKSSSEVLSRLQQLLNKNGEINLVFERRFEGKDIQKEPETFTVEELKPAKHSRVYSYYYDSDDEEMEGLLDEDTAYITLEGFLNDADSQFLENLAEFKRKGKKNLILDLRTNFGGNLTILQNIASHLISDAIGSDKVTLMHVEYKNSGKAPVYTTGNHYANYNFGKIIALTDENSASATEVLLAAMTDYGTLTAQVGRTTYGKAVMQSYFEYKQTYGMYITVAKIYYPLSIEKSYNNIGLIPKDENKVDFNYAGEFKYDNTIARAIELI
jgi:carboxyl-terminal processing protease